MFFKKSIQLNVVLQPACRATSSSRKGAKSPFFSQIADILLVMLNLFQQFTHLSYSFQVCKVLKQVQDDIETWIISLGAPIKVRKGGVGVNILSMELPLPVWKGGVKSA